MGFAVSVDYRTKIKESERRDKYLDLSRELRKLRNMKVTVIPVSFYWCTWNDLQRIEKADKNCWKLEEESRPFKLRHWSDRPEY